MGNPCPGYTVTTPFGQPGGWSAGYHTGEDYAAPKGALVHAAAAGTVIEAGWQGDYGNRIDIQHDIDDVEHSYSHLDDMWVTPGAHVEAGEAIGLVGTTGNSTGPHLHYEERDEPYGYNDHREPQYSHSGDNKPQRPLRRPRMILVSNPDGQIHLVALAGPVYIHDPGALDEVKAALADPSHVARVDQSTWENMAAYAAGGALP